MWQTDRHTDRPTLGVLKSLDRMISGLKKEETSDISGIGTGCIGLLLTCVGLGERGFLSPHLKLLGPSIIIFGQFMKSLKFFIVD